MEEEKYFEEFLESMHFTTTAPSLTYQQLIRIGFKYRLPRKLKKKIRNGIIQLSDVNTYMTK